MAERAQGFLAALRAAAGDSHVLTEPAERWTYGYDNSRQHAQPGAVVFGTDSAQVARIIHCCHDYDVPVVARGRGTGTTGGSVPIAGGVVLTLERMQRIVAFEPANRLMTVEAGVLNQAVQERAATAKLFWPPDPTSAAFCTVGGNVALNAAGPRAVKYGATRENVLGLTAVTGRGDIVHLGSHTTKSVVGYDFTRLLIGSEGTLAIVTEAILKLTPLPGARRTLQAVYRDIHAATEAVVALMGQPVIPCALEFMDQASIDMIRNYATAPLPQAAGAMLMIEVDGQAESLAAAVEAVSHAARNPGLVELRVADSDAEVEALWATRKALSPALRTIAPNKLNEDVVVPVSRIPALIDGVAQLSREFAIPIVNFGHAGNGNIHVNLLYDTRDPVQEQNAQPCLTRVFELVLALGGTLSGEHGIGLAKRDFMARALDPGALALMRAVKREWDPKGILNPGKVLPPDSRA
jgi:D-lactate dehydrogenase